MYLTKNFHTMSKKYLINSKKASYYQNKVVSYQGLKTPGYKAMKELTVLFPIAID